MSKTTRMIVANVVAAFLLAGAAQAGLVNFYSFNNQTLTDEAANYRQNAGATTTDLTMNDPSGLHGVNFTAGIGRQYDPSETGNYAINIKGHYQDYTGSEALTFPDGDVDIALGTDFTIEMWVHTGDSTSYSGHTNVTFLAANNYGIRLADHNRTFPHSAGAYALGGTSVTGAAWPQSWLAPNPWVHVGLVFRSNGTYTYYRNGDEEVLDGTYDPALFGTTTALKIGAAGVTHYTPNSVDCYIDDLAMWNEALDAATMKDHAAIGYGLTLTPEPATLLVLALGGGAVLRRRRR